MNKKFAAFAASEENPKYPKLIERKDRLYSRPGDPRSQFARDYNRILHCTAYRRLRHKTQVFFATQNDHICTRMEHVNHVTAIGHTISKAFGLDTELTRAIAIGHDIGHAPFGHEGEKILNSIARAKIREQFWHERNSLQFADNLETLADPENKERNLALTYGVRDGIICHCGEIDQGTIFPRNEPIDLTTISKPAEYQPFTWEGCVVKIADKIAFLGRDIEDIFTLGFLTRNDFVRESAEAVPELPSLFSGTIKTELESISNTAIIHSFILDLLNSSSPETGLQFSRSYLDLVSALRIVSDRLIYNHPRLQHFKKLAKLVLRSVFDELSSYYEGNNTLRQLQDLERYAPKLHEAFEDWVIKYTNANQRERKSRYYYNRIVYDMNKRRNYHRAILDFISGMTDSFAISVFDELIQFR
jgi:dGTPase